MLYPGDGKSHPRNGDVVQLHYTAMLAENSKVIESSRKMRHRPFEFVVGTGQVIRGWDVAIKQVSERDRKEECEATTNPPCWRSSRSGSGARSQ